MAQLTHPVSVTVFDASCAKTAPVDVNKIARMIARTARRKSDFSRMSVAPYLPALSIEVKTARFRTNQRLKKAAYGMRKDLPLQAGLIGGPICGEDARAAIAVRTSDVVEGKSLARR